MKFTFQVRSKWLTFSLRTLSTSSFILNFLECKYLILILHTLLTKPTWFLTVSLNSFNILAVTISSPSWTVVWFNITKDKKTDKMNAIDIELHIMQWVCIPPKNPQQGYIKNTERSCLNPATHYLQTYILKDVSLSPQYTTYKHVSRIQRGLWESHCPLSIHVMSLWPCSVCPVLHVNSIQVSILRLSSDILLTPFSGVPGSGHFSMVPSPLNVMTNHDDKNNILEMYIHWDVTCNSRLSVVMQEITIVQIETLLKVPQSYLVVHRVHMISCSLSVLWVQNHNILFLPALSNSVDLCLWLEISRKLHT